jgi:hypothetical protein
MNKANIEKLIKLLYALVEEHKEYNEELAVQEDTGLNADEQFESDKLLGALIIADLKLQDAMLTWVNTNNMETLTVQQRKDLFGLLGQFKIESIEDVQ